MPSFKSIDSVLNPDVRTELERFEPLWDYVLMEVPPKNQATKGGLHLPDGSSLANTTKMKVIKSGKGAYNGSLFVENPIKAGMYVYSMGRIAPFTIVLDGTTYLIASGRDCVGMGT